MRIIGIHGKARSGKDELADILCHTYGFKKVSFANHLKKMAIQYFGLTVDEVYVKKTKESRMILQGLGNSVRQHALNLNPVKESPIGTKTGYYSWVEKIALSDFYLTDKDLKSRPRKYARNVLTGIQNFYLEQIEDIKRLMGTTGNQYWINKLSETLTDDVCYVITDVRYKNEKDWLEETGNKTIKIYREDKPEIEAGENHPSEVELDQEQDTDWDFVVVNQHKSNWKELLLLAASDVVRYFKFSGFFTENDVKKFKINVDGQYTPTG